MTRKLSANLAQDLRLYLRLLAYLRPHRLKLALAVTAMLGVSGITALLAYMVKPVLDEVFLARQLKMLYLLPPLVIILYLIKGSLAYAHQYLMSFIGNGIINRMRDELFGSLQRQPLGFFDSQATGNLMSRLTYDVNLLQSSVTRVVTGFFKDSFTVAGLAAVIFYREWRLALLAVLVFPLALFSIIGFGQRLRRISHRSQVANADLTTVLQGSFAGQRIVKAFVREDYEAQRFARVNREYFRLQMKWTATRELTSPVMELLGALGIAGIIFYGGYNVIRGHSSPGTFFSFLAALLMLYAPIKGLSQVHNTVQEGLAAAQRVFGLMDRVPEIRNRPGAQPLPTFSQEIVFQGVSCNYQDRPALKDINLTVRRGEVVAIVGPSGAGKTTLLNLIPRFYEVKEGAILIDGRDIRAVTLESLRDQIAVVTQDTILFNDTVRYNVAYGNLKAGEGEIIGALRAAFAYDFVTALPQGLETVIGEQGVRLSGGERQRLAIARALLKDPQILILDEATSQLDSEAEKEVQRALDRLIQGRTTLLAAHRLSAVRHADRIVVLAAGRIAGIGVHNSLLQQNALYRRLYEQQSFLEPREPADPGPLAQASEK